MYNICFKKSISIISVNLAFIVPTSFTWLEARRRCTSDLWNIYLFILSVVLVFIVQTLRRLNLDGVVCQTTKIVFLQQRKTNRLKITHNFYYSTRFSLDYKSLMSFNMLSMYRAIFNIGLTTFLQHVQPLNIFLDILSLEMCDQMLLPDVYKVSLKGFLTKHRQGSLLRRGYCDFKRFSNDARLLNESQQFSE